MINLENTTSSTHITLRADRRTPPVLFIVSRASVNQAWLVTKRSKSVTTSSAGKWFRRACYTWSSFQLFEPIVTSAYRLWLSWLM